MGCGASTANATQFIIPSSDEMPAEPEYDLPLWNEQSKGKLQGLLSRSGRSGLIKRYKMQSEKLFLGSLAEADCLTRFSEAAIASMQAYVPFLRKMVNMQHKTSLQEIVIDGNAFIGGHECMLQPGYRYDNASLKILISKPKKIDGLLPGIVLASPIGVDGAPVELWDWYGRLMASVHNAVVFNVAFRPGRPETPLPAGMLDLLASLKYMIAQAPELGVDTSRIAIACQSAGSHVACPLPLELAARGEAGLVKLVFMESPGPAPFSCDLLGPYETMPHFFRYCTEIVSKEQYIAMAGPHTWEDRFRKKDPVFHVHYAADELLAKMPKHIIFGAEFDEFRMVHEEYAAKLLKCGVLLDFMILPGGGHQDVCSSLFSRKSWNVETIRKHL